MPLDKSPRQNRVRETLGRLYDEHPPHFREYLRRYEEDPTSRVFAPLAEAYRRLGRVEDAIQVCQQGLQHHPDFHGGRVALAKCYIDKERYAQAKVELRRVIEQVPENLLAQRLLGDVSLPLGETAEAIHCYKMALVLSPEDVALAQKVHALEEQMKHGISLSPKVLQEFRREDSGREDLATANRADELGMWLAEMEIEINPEGSLQLTTPSLEEEGMNLPFVPEEKGTSAIDVFLGAKDDESQEEPFRVEHVSHVFEASADQKKEITTETLADLYFAQGQFDRSLRIFEKLELENPSTEVARKIDLCRMRLGVDEASISRNRKISALQGVLEKLREARS